ncbi:MAG: PLP-dependent aminotransferase family protein [Rhodobacteraceae bacterium]|nr:PLP-dependent aminotransferase family protein [Paracoccaceae bacterium]
MGTNWQPDISSFDGPKYLALHYALRDAISESILKSGDRLPPVRELAWSLQITPGTVARAYRKATDEGILEAAVGRGTFVANPATPNPQKQVSSLLMVEDVSGSIDLRGSKNPSLGQDFAIQEAFAQLAKRPEPKYILYPGIDSDLPARKAVCDWLGYTDIVATPDDVALSYGTQNSVLVALQAILKGPSPVVVTDELVFPGMRHAPRLLRANTISVERDENGMLPDKLEKTCRLHAPQVLLTSTNVHNPTTGTTSLERRVQIAEIAEKYDLKIIDDDAYGTFASDIPSMRQIAKSRVWHASSLSKSFASGIRFGFLVTPPDQGSVARAIIQSGCYGMAQPLIDLATRVIANNAADTTRLRIVEFNRHRIQIAVNILGRWDLRWRKEVPFLWLQLPLGWRGSSFLRACEQNGVLLFAADEFALSDGKAPNAVRISIGATYSEKDFERALRTISSLLEEPPISTEI